MIKETEKGNDIHFFVWPDIKENKKILIDLVTKIKNKKNEPFSKIFVTLFPPYTQPLMLLCQKENVVLKNLKVNKTQVMLEF